MPEPPRGLPLAQEAPQPLRVAAHVSRQELECYDVAQQEVAGPVYGAHTALTDEGLDFVDTVEGRPPDRRRGVDGRLAVLRAQELIRGVPRVASRAVEAHGDRGCRRAEIGFVHDGRRMQ